MQDVAARHALRDRFVTGHAEIVEFLRQKWQRELNYTLRKAMWAYTGTKGRRSLVWPKRHNRWPFRPFRGNR